MVNRKHKYDRKNRHRTLKMQIDHKVNLFYYIKEKY